MEITERAGKRESQPKNSEYNVDCEKKKIQVHYESCPHKISILLMVKEKSNEYYIFICE